MKVNQKFCLKKMCDRFSGHRIYGGVEGMSIAIKKILVSFKKRVFLL